MSLIVKDSVSSGVVLLTLNNELTRNAISDQEMIDELVSAVVEADRDKNVRAVILTGSKGVFSSGGNLKKMGASGGISHSEPAVTRMNYKQGIQTLPHVFESLEVPIIAAINGPAIGAGCDLALMCDIRVASSAASFSESFVKLGIVPGDGGAWLLPRVVGFSKAVEMSLTGDSVYAEEALSIGLVSRVVEPENLISSSLSLAIKISNNPRHAVRMTKRLIKYGYTSSLSCVLEMSAAMQAIGHTTWEHEEAVASVLEKRRPKFY